MLNPINFSGLVENVERENVEKENVEKNYHKGKCRKEKCRRFLKMSVGKFIVFILIVHSFAQYILMSIEQK
jgi:hypothetical protein